MVTLAFGQVVAGVFAYFENPFGGWYGIRNIPPPQPAAFFGTLDKAAQIANQKTANANCTVRSFELKEMRVVPVTAWPRSSKWFTSLPPI